MNLFNDDTEYLLIDKADDFHYFKNLQSIADYLNLKKTQVHAIHSWCFKNYTRQPKSKLFIQRLYIHNSLHQPNNTLFIWDYKQRMQYKKAIAYKYWYQENLV